MTWISETNIKLESADDRIRFGTENLYIISQGLMALNFASYALPCQSLCAKNHTSLETNL